MINRIGSKRVVVSVSHKSRRDRRGFRTELGPQLGRELGFKLGPELGRELGREPRRELDQS